MAALLVGDLWDDMPRAVASAMRGVWVQASRVA